MLEQRLKFQIGELVFMNTVLSVELESAKARIAELEANDPASGSIKDDTKD